MRLAEVKGEVVWSALEERLLDCAPQENVAPPSVVDCGTLYTRRLNPQKARRIGTLQ